MRILVDLILFLTVMSNDFRAKITFLLRSTLGVRGNLKRCGNKRIKTTYIFHSHYFENLMNSYQFTQKMQCKTCRPIVFVIVSMCILFYPVLLCYFQGSELSSTAGYELENLEGDYGGSISDDGSDESSFDSQTVTVPVTICLTIMVG